MEEQTVNDKVSVEKQPDSGETQPQGYYHSQKNRIFVRAVQGEYNLTKELERLRAMPRVRKAREIKFVDGPQAYSRHYVEPKDGITQMFPLHLEEWAPGGKRIGWEA